MALITEAYREQNALLHQKDPGYGAGAGGKCGGKVRELMQTYATQSVLDYGCGKGTLAKLLPSVRNYDPAMPEFSAPPEPADIVICRDVMEHVEADCIDDVLDDIKRLTRKVAWLNIVCRPATKNLPDGRNTHISVYPRAWWLDKLRERFTVLKDAGDELEFSVLVQP